MSFKHHGSQVRVKRPETVCIDSLSTQVALVTCHKPLWGFFAWTSLVSLSDVETGAVSWALPSGTC